MKKVYQDKFGKGNGNCVQAAFAALFEVELKEAPHVLNLPDDIWWNKLSKFIEDHGGQFDGALYNNREQGKKSTLDQIKDHDGIDGFFYAGVYSPGLYKESDKVEHAVIIDKDFNIVHDPNPKYKDLKEYPEAKKIGYNGILDVWLISKKSQRATLNTQNGD